MAQALGGARNGSFLGRGVLAGAFLVRLTGRLFPTGSAFHSRGSAIHHNGAVTTASIVSWVLDQLYKLPSTLVYVTVFLLVFGEAALFIGFILPGETAVLVGGAIASQGHVNIVWLCALVVVAAIVGDTVGYFIGGRWGHHLLKLPIVRHRHVLIQRALDGLNRRGPIYVFLGRFTAFLRAVMPGLAGMSKMHYRRFLVANALGGLCWGTGFTLIGYYGAATLKKFEKYASWAGITMLCLIVVGVGALHVTTKRREAAAEKEWIASHPGEAVDAD